jgi:hypothetical protein
VGSRLADAFSSIAHVETHPFLLGSFRRIAKRILISFKLGKEAFVFNVQLLTLLAPRAVLA